MSKNEEKPQIMLLETPFLSLAGTEEVKEYVQSKYNLALLALGSYLKAHRPDIGVSIVNMQKDQIGKEELLELLTRQLPHVIGVPLYSYNLSYTYEIISAIKQQNPSIAIIVGGPHAAIFPKETVELPNIDYMVLGDGEVPFFKLCTEIIDHGSYHSAELPAGVFTKKSSQGITQFIAHKHENLDDLPLPDLTLMGDYKRYRDFLSNKVMGILTTSRGCPFKCHYCWSEKSTYRDFSIEKIVDIMKHYRDMGVEYIEFWDETFNPSWKRMDDFAQAILDAKLEVTWSIRGAVVQNAPLETMKKLKRAGLRIIQFGVESTDPKILAQLNKKIDRNKIREAFENCHKAGVRSVANMMINIPGQTLEQIQSDFSMLTEIKPTYVSLSIYNWAPGTTHYERAVKEKILSNDFWREHARNPVGPDPLVHPQNGVAIADIEKIRDKFLFSYYFNPLYILRYMAFMSLSEFKRAIEIGLMMFKSLVKQRIVFFKANFQ